LSCLVRVGKWVRRHRTGCEMVITEWKPRIEYDQDVTLLHGCHTQIGLRARLQISPIKSRISYLMMNHEGGRLWRTCKDWVKARAGYKCECCGSTDHLFVHKEFRHLLVLFPKSRNLKPFPVEVLTRLVLLCWDCHINIAHIDIPPRRGKNGKLIPKNRKRNTARFAELNGWNFRITNSYLDQKDKIKLKRNQIGNQAIWRQDWTFLIKNKIVEALPKEYKMLQSARRVRSVRILKAWWLPQYADQEILFQNSDQ